ncbi:CPBP family glutamic-type intramembrane protease [Oceanirhabdus sp. W0125-5]|uniref:CPBP family glutamic-type intramembrane protease n=1 Tax=Oceanirhabdus sp. W0125-5 TaxID=2999116 RepID=UPI0022F312B1|nr:CPBP family glutamic-type intramembrane protease [Oceanirhabdus sp. W0125-5]WBW95641.1 hypothetical protein OW730_18355 [Oceanirhabdus sp. W0125-5]
MKSELRENNSMRRTEKHVVKILLLFAVIGSVLGIFIVRTLIDKNGGNPPRLFNLFNMIILIISLGILIGKVKLLKKRDIIISIVIGAFLGIHVNYSTFFPLIKVNDNKVVTGIFHGGTFIVIFLAGIIVMRMGGPVQVALIIKDWRRTIIGILFGCLIGLPLAIFNAYAFSVMNNSPFIVQTSLLPLVDALQPGIIEEVVYRFTLIGILWLVLRRAYPKHSVVISGVIATLVHNYAHFNSLFYEKPIFALAYGGIICLLFGVPMLILALKKDLETAIAFHWIQDAVRFMGGL